MSVRFRKKSRSWEVDIHNYILPNGQKVPRIRKSKKSWTKRDAEKWERDTLVELRLGSYGRRKEVPKLSEFKQEFMDNYSRVNNEPSEVKSKETHFRKHLLPELGKMRLDEIGVRDLERFKRIKQDEEYNPTTINKILQTLRKTLNVAQEWEIIDRVPKFKKLKEPEPVFDFLEFWEADSLIASAEKEWRAMIVIALKCGMRPGELHALRWDDIDFNRTTPLVHVRRSISREGRIGPPKNSRSRVLPLCDDAVEALIAHKHKNGIWVFCDENGGPLRDNKCKHPLKRACNEAGLRQISWYTMRHTFASHLVMRGAPIVTVQELMGHATIQMTMRYAHLSQDVKIDAVQLLNSRGTIGAQPESQMAN